MVNCINEFNTNHNRQGSRLRTGKISLRRIVPDQPRTYMDGGIFGAYLSPFESCYGADCLPSGARGLKSGKFF